MRHKITKLSSEKLLDTPADTVARQGASGKQLLTHPDSDALQVCARADTSAGLQATLSRKLNISKEFPKVIFNDNITYPTHLGVDMS